MNIKISNFQENVLFAGKCFIIMRRNIRKPREGSTMGTQIFTYEDVISYAVLIEQRGAKLYTQAAEGANSEPAKNVLKFLAEQEKKHEKYFLKLKEEIQAGNKSKVNMDDETVGYLGALAKGEIFPESTAAFSKRFGTLKDVVAFGKQTEKDSILFYNELLSLGWDEQTEEILRAIIKEEKKHLVQLTELDELVAERDVFY